ncbi:135_t:CDS:2 [Paraglomus brasilianum]|uniref:135_t:CDS:1 n=1 Tax=Paraglomus brasilianum TaxID=144538 RepID=A0A9N9BBJ1_9GLOM|nr:135_t:CDS:2 [Paraglomus brasilianum]
MSNTISAQQGLLSSPNWDNLWQRGVTPWDKGDISPALRELIEEKQFSLPEGRGLVPGCGKGYDVVYLANEKLHMTGMDLSATAIEHCKAKQASYNIPSTMVDYVVADFYNFEPPEGGYQLIYDYTFLCAFHPEYRPQWATRMSQLVTSGGFLITLMYPLGDHTDGPPFALSKEIYDQLLSENFTLIYYDKCKGHPSRDGKEMMGVWKRK